LTSRKEHWPSVSANSWNFSFNKPKKWKPWVPLQGGIAHDFNNILAAIIGYTEIVAAETEKTSDAYEYLQRVLTAGERARSLVKQILAFSRQGEMEPKPVQIKLIVKEVLKLLRASLPATIEIIEDIRSSGAVMADPTQIHQVMLNLGTNAGYAMGKWGEH
jgi:signal transduction histidine kinase